MKAERIVKNIVVGVLKAVLIVVAYAIFHMLVPSQFFNLVSEAVPLGLDVFIYVVACLKFASSLLSGSIFKYFVDFAMGLFVLFYLALSNGTVSVSMQKITVEIDATALTTAFTLASALSLAQTVMNAINHLSEKA
jgi:hypothetical protein